jgi:hypothetical protein
MLTWNYIYNEGYLDSKNSLKTKIDIHNLKSLKGVPTLPIWILSFYSRLQSSPKEIFGLNY